MRLAYLSQSRIPSREANAVHVMRMCAAFAALGHEVVLFAPDIATDEPDAGDPFAFYGVSRSFEIRKLPWARVKGRAWIYGWQAGRATRGAFDAAYGRSLHACAVAAFGGLPTAWDAHMGTFLARLDERVLFKRMIASAHFRGMTTNCSALRSAIVAAVPPVADRVVAAQNGADPVPDDLAPADLGGEPGRLQAGYVGQLYPGKGLETILAIAALAPWADFHVVGGNRDRLADIAAGVPLPPNLRLHGFVRPADTARALVACDVLLAPYQREVETAGGGDTGAWMSPLKLFDYMASGRAILCSDLPVLREIMDPELGVLLPPGDAQAWAGALARLAADAEERRRLGQAAKARFLARHTWRRRAEIAIGVLTQA